MATPQQQKPRPASSTGALVLQGVATAFWLFLAIMWLTVRDGRWDVFLGFLAVLLAISNAWLLTVGVRARRRRAGLDS